MVQDDEGERRPSERFGFEIVGTQSTPTLEFYKMELRS
jgi:hypothetical protein